MTDPQLRTRLAQLGGELEQLLEPLVSWIREAQPLLAEYRTTAVALPEAVANPAWLVELPEAARVMGLAVGAARLLEEAAGTDEEPAAGDWAYVEFLLGVEGAARLRAGSPAMEPVATEVLLQRLDHLEATQRRLTALVEAFALTFGAASSRASEAMDLEQRRAGVRNPHAA